MSKLDDIIEKSKEEYKGLSGTRSPLDEDLLAKVAKGLGPSIYDADASLVSCSDKEELDRVKKNFLIGKLGLKDGPELDAAIQEVCQQFGNDRNKMRVIFYYQLVKKFKKESVYE